MTEKRPTLWQFDPRGLEEIESHDRDADVRVLAAALRTCNDACEEARASQRLVAPVLEAALALEDGNCRPWTRDEYGSCNWCGSKKHTADCEAMRFIAEVQAYRARVSP